MTWSQKGTGRASARPVSAMPEALTRRDVDGGSWRVVEGLPIRGDAATDVEARTMRVPFGDAVEARAIRAHEMTHAKVSPGNLDEIVEVTGLREGSIRAVEEVRVNLLAMSAGFDLDALVDGSERTTGRRCAEANAVTSLVEMGVGTLFTKGGDEFRRGVKDANPEMAKRLDVVLDAIEKSIVDDARSNGLRGRLNKRTKGRRVGDALRSTLASTTRVRVDTDGTLGPVGDDVPRRGVDWTTIPYGFRFTLDLARLVDQLTEPSPNGDGPTLPDPESPVVPTRPGGGDWWAPLVWDRSVSLNRWASNSTGRRRVSSDVGRVPRHLDRMLTDPARRIFSRDVRSTGGIVLIDQSGSMSLSIAEVEQLVEASAGATVIGYSNRHGCPNIWTLAERGRIATSVRDGNGGNGCDRPALDHALSIRRGSEPVIWVCDGWVTFSRDGHASADERLRLIADVYRHGVHMVADVDDAVDALRRARSGRLPAQHVPTLAQGIATRLVDEAIGGRR